MALAIIAKIGKKEEQVDVAQSKREAEQLVARYKDLYGTGVKVFYRPLRNRYRDRDVEF